MQEYYQVIYDAETKITMTKEEVQKFLTELNKGSGIVEFKGNFLTKFFRVICKKELTEGYLHDGTKVKKIHGEWKDASDPTLKLNTNYFPEISKDEVMSEDQFLEKSKVLQIQN